MITVDLTFINTQINQITVNSIIRHQRIRHAC